MVPLLSEAEGPRVALDPIVFDAGPGEPLAPRIVYPGMRFVGSKEATRPMELVLLTGDVPRGSR